LIRIHKQLKKNTRRVLVLLQFGCSTKDPTLVHCGLGSGYDPHGVITRNFALHFFLLNKKIHAPATRRRSPKPIVLHPTPSDPAMPLTPPDPAIPPNPVIYGLRELGDDFHMDKKIDKFLPVLAKIDRIYKQAKQEAVGRLDSDYGYGFCLGLLDPATNIRVNDISLLLDK